MNILVITTGGTIGSVLQADPRRPPKFVDMPLPGHDFVRDVLAKEAGSFCRIISNEPLDSKLIDDPYRYALLNIIETAPEKRILITHGTDTILQTAAFFYSQFATNPALAGKIIFLTGSMIPLANGQESDGYLNLKLSIEQLRRPAVPDRSTSTYIVLCDYERSDDTSSAWKPRLYPYHPGQYEKFTADDGRYNRLRRTG